MGKKMIGEKDDCVVLHNHFLASELLRLKRYADREQVLIPELSLSSGR